MGGTRGGPRSLPVSSILIPKCWRVLRDGHSVYTDCCRGTFSAEFECHAAHLLTLVYPNANQSIPKASLNVKSTIETTSESNTGHIAVGKRCIAANATPTPTLTSS